MKFTFKQQGFSVVELMVALLLGLFLVSGVTGMYISSKQTYRMTDNLSRLQESLRFSLEFISRDIRMAGYMPCRFPPIIRNVIDDPVTGDATTGANAWFLDFFNFGIHGYEGGVDTFPTDIAGNVVSGTDAIAILKGGLYSASVEFNNNATNNVTLQDSYPGAVFGVGEIAIVCDPRQAAIFQISGRNPAGGTINYAPSIGIDPNNSTTNIGSFGDDAQITPYEPVIYFIAPSAQNPTVNSLKKRYLVAEDISGVETADMREEELLEGVESMQILYGIDIDNDQIADRFEAANDVTAANHWLHVITVRLGLLMATGEEVTTQIDANTYNVAGTLISNITNPAHGADRRLRYVVNTTINLRNRIAN